MVRLPSGDRYWTVLDDDLKIVGCADAYLRYLRFGRDCAEGTTSAYASSLALFLGWCQMTRRDWREAGAALGSFILRLRHSPAPDSPQVLIGPGAGPVRGERRINAVLAAVRGLLSFAVTSGQARPEVLGHLYEIGDTRDLPLELRGETARVLPLAKARTEVSQEAQQRHSDLVNRLESAATELQTAHLAMSLQWEEEKRRAVQIDARGLPLIGLGILMTGVPDGLATWDWFGWWVTAVAVILMLWLAALPFTHAVIRWYQARRARLVSGARLTS